MALELQQEKKAQAERERLLKEQKQKIENLSTMVINSAVDDRDLDRRNKKVSILSDEFTSKLLKFHELISSISIIAFIS